MDFEPTQQQIEGGGTQFEATQLQLANLHDEDDEDQNEEFQATQMQPAGADFNATQAQTEEQEEPLPAASTENTTEQIEKNTDAAEESENKEVGGVDFDEEEDAPAKPKTTTVAESTKTPEDDDDEDINEAEIKKNTEKLKGKRKKHKEAGEGEEKQKRKKRRGGGDDNFKMDEEDENATNKQSNAEEGDEFEQIIRKADVKKGRFAADKFETTAKTTASDLLEKMRKAAIEDIKAYDQGSLALSKLELLPEVTDKCAKLYLQPALIEQGILSVLGGWITPLEKGTLPDLNIRTGVLKALMDLPLKTDASAQFEGGIEAEDLTKCGIASKVKMLANHPKEIPNNKKLASTLVERWSRLFYGLSDNYKDANPSTAPKTAPRKPKPKPVEAPQQQGPSRRARIPKKEGFDFTIDPKAVFKEVPKQEAKENTVQKRLSRKLSELRKPSRKKFV